jgi:AcrR family transcriptional regulator
MAASIEQKGYRDTTVADVVRIARTSRRSFYEHFEDRAACFLALFAATNMTLMEGIAEAVHPDAPWETQVEQAVGAYLDSVAAQPALSRSFVRELPALGEPGGASQLAAIELFARLLVRLVELGRREQPEIEAGPLTMDVAIIIVGGLRELVVIAIQQGRDVRELRATATAAARAILRATVLPRAEQALPARS